MNSTNRRTCALAIVRQELRCDRIEQVPIEQVPSLIRDAEALARRRRLTWPAPQTEWQQMVHAVAIAFKRLRGRMVNELVREAIAGALLAASEERVV
jgi:hypothetical protein